MSADTVFTPNPSGEISQLAPGSWLLRDPAAVRYVLTADEVFCPAKRSEFVPGYSRSFFLAVELAPESEKPRFRRALASALSPRRLSALSQRVLVPVAEALAAKLPKGEDFDLRDEFIWPYTRRVSYALAGLPDATGAELVARLRVAGELFTEEDNSPAAHTLLGQVWTEVDSLAQRGRLEPSGLPAHAVARGLVTPDEAVLLALPFLEMAAFDMSAVLVQATIEHVARRTPPQTSSLRLVAAEAAGGLAGIYPTRVARQRVVIADHTIDPGDRLVLDVAAANSAAGCPSAAATGGRTATDHLSFGAGAHVCLGKELSLDIAAVAVSAFLRHGYLHLAGDNRIRIQPTSTKRID